VKLAKLVMVGVLVAVMFVPAVVLGRSKLGIFLEDRIVDRGKGQALDSYMTELEKVGFNGAVLVAEGDAVILHNGYGLADADKGVRNYSTTVFSTGSLTRLFTVVAILQQIDEMVISTDDPLDRFFNDVPADKQGITIHDMLSGSSGGPMALAPSTCRLMRSWLGYSSSRFSLLPGRKATTRGLTIISWVS